MFESRYINYSLIRFRVIRAKYGANKNKIRRDNRVSSFFYIIYQEPPLKINLSDICTDEIQFLVNTSGSEDLGFSFTRIMDSDPALYRVTSLELWILGYSIGDCHDQSQGYEDTLGRR